jgi:hypothetical protein
MKNSLILASVLMFSAALTGAFYYANSNLMQAHAEDDCEDKAFKKYMKKGDKPFERYLDKADNVPLPKDEDDVKDYLDDLDPLAKDYIDDLQPYARQYIDDLEDCLN